MKITPYLRIIRVDHWFKNVFMIPGVLLYFFFHAGELSVVPYGRIVLGLLAACLVASSNYVLNELIDAPRDRHHPVKKHRPVPSGQVNPAAAVVLWLLLAALGMGCGFFISVPMGLSLAALWLAGVAYNTPPLRTKDIPFLDVLSESFNNPLRLLLGWYSTGSGRPAPLSALLAYWMFGGFLMALKRFAEYRSIGDRETARAYRKSFAFYSEERLLISVFFYVVLFGFLSGFFVARYKMELILAAPAVAFTMALYYRVGFQADSVVQTPEALYRRKGLMAAVALTFMLCAWLLFARLPALKSWLAPRIPPPLPTLPIR